MSSKRVVYCHQDRRFSSYTVQKFHGDKFMSKRYLVNLDKLYAMTAGASPPPVIDDSDSDSDDEVPPSPLHDQEGDEPDAQDDIATSSSSDDAPHEPLGARRSNRARRPPQWLGEWER